MQTIRDGVMMVDRDGSILLMNDEAQRLAAVAPGQPGERPIVAMLASLGFSGRGQDDALRLLQDGKAVRLVNDVAPDGGIPLVEVSGTPTRNAEGEVAGAVWVLRDITHIARAEQERAKAAHLESLGVLAGGLAHDFNNILTGVVGNLSLAQDLVRPEQQALRTRLEQAAAASARARGVTNQLLTFSREAARSRRRHRFRSLSSSARVSSSAAHQWRRDSIYPMARGRPMSTRTRSPRWCTISS